jgi:MscS family membrane protein
MCSFVERTTNLLTQHPDADQASVRVSFLYMGAFSLDVEVFAYIRARDWVHFLEIQGELLLQIMEILQDTSIQMAVQPHAVSLLAPANSNGDSPQMMVPNFAAHERSDTQSAQGAIRE